MNKIKKVALKQIEKIIDLNDVEEINFLIKLLRGYRNNAKVEAKNIKDEKKRLCKQFQDGLNDLRKTNKLSIQGLATKMEVSKSYAEQLCNNTTTMPFHRMVQLMGIFNIPKT